MKDADSTNMTDKQQLYPDELYALHRVLKTAQQEVEPLKQLDEKIVVQPILFSKHSRSFHWMAVWPTRWKFNNQLLEDFARSLTGIEESERNVFYEHRLPKRLHRFKKAKEDIEKWLQNKRPIDSDNEGENSRLHRNLLALYEGCRHNPYLNVDGIVYREIEKLHENPDNRHIRIMYGNGVLLDDDAKKNSYENTPWLKATFYLSNGETLKRYSCQEADRKEDAISDIENRYKDPYKKTEKVATKFLDIFFLDKFKRPPNSAGNTPLLIVPVYDARIRGETCGNLWGSLTLLPSGNDGAKKLRRLFDGEGKDVVQALQDTAYRITQELRGSAITTILTQPIEPRYDLVDHFAKHLHMLQDWQRIIVFEANGDGKPKPLYCYGWFPKNGAPGKDRVAEWEYIEWKRKECEDCPETCNWEDPLDDRRYLRWEEGHHIWNEALIPSMSEGEKNRLECFRLVFEYPKTAVIPKDDSSRELLDKLYLRQQLEVLRGLMRKVRARRHALRTAAVSIMSRNMSHNMGSHVLARISDKNIPNGCNEDFLEGSFNELNSLALKGKKGEIGETKELKNKLRNHVDSQTQDSKKCNTCYRSNNLGKKVDRTNELIGMCIDHIYVNYRERSDRTKLFHYLQERMDFLAEAATSRMYMALSTRLENSIVEFCKQELICLHISGIEGLEAHVDHKKEKENKNLSFASPGGRLGQHALYIIFENIIRNTAKHGRSNNSKGRLQIYVRADVVDVNKDKKKENTQQRKMLKVLVWDERGNAKDEIEKEKGEKSPLWKYLKTVVEQKPMIDQSGAVEPDNWGIREMMLSAAYLRGIAFEDMEGRIYPPLLEPCVADNNGAFDEESGKNLAYCFFLELPKEVLVVGDEFDSAKEELTKQGIDIVHTIKQAESETRHHPFMIIMNKNTTSAKNPGRLPIAAWWNNGSGRANVPVLSNGDLKALKMALKNSKSKGERVIVLLEAQWQSYLSSQGRHGLNGNIKLYRGDGCNGNPLGAERPTDFPEPGANVIIFDRHAAWLENGLLENGSPLFWEPYDQPDPQQIFFENPGDGDAKEAMEHRFYSAAISRIAVLDERVQQAAHEAPDKIKNGYSKRMYDMLELRRIHVPEKGSCDLDKPQQEEIQQYIERITNGSVLDFLVIHQGILDRIRNNETEEEVGAWIQKLAKNAGANLVVCSGRGVPSGLAKGWRFIPVSSVIHWTISQPSKYHLYLTLMASRSPKHG